MGAEESSAILTIALMAAFADGLKDDRERAAVKQVADALGADAGMDLPALYRDVLLSKPDLALLAGALKTPESRQLAYEMAVGVCDSDGAQGAAEKDFLRRLATVLGLPEAGAREVSSHADEVADAAFATDEPAAAAAGAATSAGATATADAGVSGTVMGKASLSDAELDKLILNASVTNAALELLPESLASMAIIPLQMRLVYRIGKAHGYAMDRTHAKDFLATLGVGLTAQYIEQFGRKLLGGLLGTAGGGLGRSVGRQAASSGLAFASTYALGRVAQRYYAGGRILDAAALKQTFAALLDEAKGLAPRYRAEIERKAATIDTRSLAALVRQT